jgi:hypothetical protein
VRGFFPAEEEVKNSTFEALDATRVGSASGSLRNEGDLKDLSFLDENEREKVLARRKKEEAKEKEKNKKIEEMAKKA